MSGKPSGNLSFTKLIQIMEKSPKNKKLFKEVGKDTLRDVFKESVSKIRVKDTVENRIKLQGLMLKGIKERRKKKPTEPKSKDQVVVPDQPPKVIKQIEKNKTPYGKAADKGEPDTVAKDAVKRDWTIVSDNCYGVAYMKALAKETKKPYESPFFSIFIYAPDYITLLENFKEYMKLTPVAQEVSKDDPMGGKSKYKRKPAKYPVLLLKGSKGDVEIHYAHEKQSPQEAIRKWTSRTKRMNMNPKDLYVKMDDRDRFTVELGKRFLKLPFPHKVLFVSQKYKDSLGGMKNVIVTDYKNQGPIGTTLEKKYPIPPK